MMFVCLQPQCQAVQDVEKAVSLFESTGRISATVMEARYTVYEGPLKKKKTVFHVEVRIQLLRDRTVY